MNAINVLGERFGLAPSTMAGLANVSGASTPDPDSPEAWQAAEEETAKKEGLPPVAPIAPAPGDTILSHGAPASAAPAAEKKYRGVAPGGGPLYQTDAEYQAAQSTGAPEVARPVSVAEVDPFSAPTVSPGITVPAHWQPGSHAVSIQHGMSPKALEEASYDEDVAAGHQLMAADKQAEAARINGQADAAYQAARAAGEQHFAQINAAREARRQAYVQDQGALLQQKLTEAQKRVDPNAYWKEMGTAGSVLTAIMIGLGQFASMWKGGSNAALDIVNDNINRNVQAQKDNIANAHTSFANQSALYRQNLDAFGDEERATLATKMAYLDQVAAMVGQAKAGAQDAQTQAAKENLISQIYGKKAEWARQFAGLTEAKVTEQGNEHFVPAQTIGGVGAEAPPREGNLVTLPNGRTYAMPEGTSEKAIEKIQALSELQAAGNEILRRRREAAALDPIADRLKYQKAIEDLKQLGTREAFLSAKAMGVPMRGDAFEKLQQSLGDPTEGLGTFKGNPLAARTRAVTDATRQARIQRAEAEQEAFVRNAGGAEYVRAYARNKNGYLGKSGYFTGRDETPIERLAQPGSKPLGEGHSTPTAQPKGEIPRAPILPGVLGGKSGTKKGGGRAAAPIADDEGDD